MIQTSVQFGGLLSEDPNARIANFLEICDTFKFNGVSSDAIKLRLFPFSLRDKAKGWLNSLPPGSITTWEDLAQKFLAKYFSPAKTAKMRNDITSFAQYDAESLYEAWERFKDLLRRCPHHGLPKWLQVQTFYNGLDGNLKSNIDAAAGGSLMAKSIDSAYELLEDMAANNYQWPIERSMRKKVAGIHEVDAITALTVQVAALSKKFDTLGGNASHNTYMTCENCGSNHATNQCSINAESVQFVGNYNRQANMNSNYYHPGLKNHPNFSWAGNHGPSSSSKPMFPPGYPPQAPPQEKKPNLEDLVAQMASNTNQLITETRTQLQSQAASIRNLEMQVGQLANSMNNRSQGVLPSNTENNPRRDDKEHCKAITLRSGKELNEVDMRPKTSRKPEEEIGSAEKQVKSQEDKPKMEESQPYNPPPPFPQRLQKQKLDTQFSKFLEVFKKLHINIPFADALEQMPSYVKFMKDILSKKRRLDDFETVALTEECSAMIQKKLPPKLKDPGSFTIPCTIGNQFFSRALCDLGASINLMPLSIYKRLGLVEAKPTNVTLQLADRSLTYPRGVVEDVLVKVDRLIFPADFIVLDMEEDHEVLIILGRPFLATGRTLIDVQKGELTMRI
ncbi:uncharacterized protein LOC112091966 [Morus notabilis]|uniref:uncharacterized protein LOC112091966 n=1 Tax=Morus notabilis TaxID=981085 RepID=UPI000CED6CE5|nr:uncharacterized protein LOC112091966 [Morus notabilis]